VVLLLLREPAHDHRLDLWLELKIGSSLVQRDGRLRQRLRKHLARRLCQVLQTVCQEEVRDGGKLYWSAAGVTDSPPSVSGATYRSVPMMNLS
jgi:hypothetical protein